MKIVKGIPEKYIEPILDWGIHFEHVMDKEYFKYYISWTVDFENSLMLLDDDENIVGAYLLNDNQIIHFVKDADRFKDLNGVEGILLFIEEQHRGKGWGDKLKDAPKDLGYDYIWGQQFKGLNNLQDWLKRRELITEIDNIYITAQIF
jgi:hypothetical protein